MIFLSLTKRLRAPSKFSEVPSWFIRLINESEVKAFPLLSFRNCFIAFSFEKKIEHLSGDKDLFGIYDELSELLMILKINSDFNYAEINKRQKLNDQEKRKYERTLVEHKRNNILEYLQQFRKQRLVYLDELNEQYKLALQKYAFKAPYNIFNRFTSLLRDINQSNIDTIRKRIVVSLKDKDFKYPLDNSSSFVYNIEHSKIIIFADAKGTEEKYYKMLPLKYRKYPIFIKRVNVSDFKVWCLYDKSKAFKYHFYNLERNPRTGKLEYKENKKFFNQIERTAFLIYCLIKFKNKKKIMIALSKAFNNGKKGKEKWNGYMMKILRGVLKKNFNIDYRELDIKLGFYYAEPGISRFDDRECLIFFNLPGVPSEINRMVRLFFGLS